MKHLGDITQIDGGQIPVVDCITFGAPCQDISVAGKRKGMLHVTHGDEETTRSGLFYEAIRIVKEMREHDRASGRSAFLVRPRYVVYENVPGALSSNEGKDFQAVLTEIVRIADPNAPDVPMPEKKWAWSGCLYDDMGRWSVAWRIHDAQFWGVPQRRKRIAVVADFGGLSAPEILFERKGLRRDSEPSEPEREETAASVGASANPSSYTLKIRGGREIDSLGHKAGKGALVQTELSGTLGVSQDQTLIQTTSDGSEVAGTLDASYYKGCGPRQGRERTVVYGISAYESNAMKSGNPNSGIYEAETARTLDLNGGSPACNQGGIAIVQSAGFDGNMGAKAGNIGYEEEKAPTLNAGKCVHCICSAEEPPMIEMTSTKNTLVEDGISPTLTARMGTSGNQVNAVLDTYQKTSGALCASGYDKLGTQEALNDMYVVNNYANEAYDKWSESEKSASLRASGGVCGGGSESLTVGYVVRRLTPTECERLQGFPDGWTDIGEWTDTKGKVHQPADSPRYKALGNSIAIPFWFYLLRRISAQYERPATLGSLFDGISGFPLAWARCNGSKSVLWTSEIEEFPIAVCKRHFGDEETGEEGDIAEYL